MWRHAEADETKRMQLLFAVMRVVAITWTGLKENRIVSRAAALSFSTLLGMGPLIALTVLVSGFVLNNTQPDMAKNAIEDAIAFIAPQVTLSNETVPEEGAALSDLITRFIEASQSGTVGVGGALVLVLIVIQLFISIEDAFNDIWGVARGRSLITRIVLYWTIITLGAVLAFAGIAVAVSEIMYLSSQFSSMSQSISGTTAIGDWISLYGAKAASFIVITTILTLFYRFIPNTQVEWRAALAGGIFAVSSFILNNTLAFLYVERIAMQRTLYGSLGILPVLMIGLYFFWLFLLLGGLVSFAVQNARFKSGKIAWDELNQASQESLCLLLFAQIARRFKACQEPLSTKELAAAHNLPRQLASAAMHRLTKLGFASALPPKSDDPFDAYRYQPAKPLEKIKIIDFKNNFESFGEEPDETRFSSSEPLVRYYHETLAHARESSFQEQTIETLLERMESDVRASLQP